MADEEHAAATLTAYVFAVAALTDTTPRSLIERMLEAIPDDEVWDEYALPELMQDIPDTQ